MHIYLLGILLVNIANYLSTNANVSGTYLKKHLTTNACTFIYQRKKTHLCIVFVLWSIGWHLKTSFKHVIKQKLNHMIKFY